jgi:ATP-dependent RNA helicase DHX29
LCSPETPFDSPIASGTTTPKLEPDTRHFSSALQNGTYTPRTEKKQGTSKKVATIDYDSDIDPDDLLPVYLESKEKLFLIQSTKSSSESRQNIKKNGRKPSESVSTNGEAAKLARKIKRIEDDVLFDKYVADQKWDVRRIQLEREGAARRALELVADEKELSETDTVEDSEDEVSREAAKIGKAMLEDTGSDDDAALSDLFASLPVTEVDPLTGKSSTVVNGNNGVKVTIRDFGKWSGVNPTRVLEEACRAR